MAYNPTTWGSNDVITKDKLNKIEQGINTASKLSGTDIDADKNWGGKNITNVGQLQANSVTTTTLQANSVTTTSYTLIPDPCIWYQNNNTQQTNSTDFTVFKTAKAAPAGVSGTVAVHYDLDTTYCYYHAYIQLRKNGSTIKNHFQSEDRYEEYVDNVAISPGDVISLAWRTSISGDYIKNKRFEIRAIPMPGQPPVMPPW